MSYVDTYDDDRDPGYPDDDEWLLGDDEDSDQRVWSSDLVDTDDF